MPRRNFKNIRNKVKPWKHKKAREMAKNQTRPEKALWERLKNKQLGAWFYKQKIILGYIVDFWCPSAGLVVEVDGPHHRKRGRKASDAKRDAVLRRKGIVTMRFTDKEVLSSSATVASLVKSRMNRRLK
jgi:very-short-patch-repair endonuclease